MKYLFLIAIVCKSLLISAQEKSFTPHWTIGEEKTVTTIRIEDDFKKGGLKSSDTTSFSYTFKVYKQTKTSYFIRFNMGNVATQSLVDFAEEMESEVDPFESLVLKYEVSKKNGSYQLINFKEVQRHALGSIDKMEQVIKERSEELDKSMAFFDLLLNPIKNIYKSEDGVNGYFIKEFDFIFEPYESKWSLGETIVAKDSAENPFKAGHQITGQKEYLLLSMNPKADTALLQVNLILDFSEFKLMMKGMMKGMMSAFIKDSVKLEKKLKELDDLEFNMENKKLITYNTRTNLPVKVKQLATIYGTDPKKGERKTDIKVFISIE